MNALLESYREAVVHSWEPDLERGYERPTWLRKLDEGTRQRKLPTGDTETAKKGAEWAAHMLRILTVIMCV